MRTPVSASLEQPGELLVVDHRRRALALEHLDQLRTRERRVEEQDVGAELGGGHAGVDEAPVVAAHDRDAVALVDAPRRQRAGQRVRATVQLARTSANRSRRPEPPARGRAAPWP